MGWLFSFSVFLLSMMARAPCTDAWGKEGHYMVCKIAEVVRGRISRCCMHVFHVSHVCWLTKVFWNCPGISHEESFQCSAGSPSTGGRRGVGFGLFMGWPVPIPVPLGEPTALCQHPGSLQLRVFKWAQILTWLLNFCTPGCSMHVYWSVMPYPASITSLGEYRSWWQYSSNYLKNFELFLAFHSFTNY